MGPKAKTTNKLKPKKPKPEWPWPDALFQRWMISHLRRITYRCPAIYQALKEAKRGRNQYECAHCHKLFPLKGINRDHLLPIVDVDKGFTTWDDWIERAFCRIEGQRIQILCREDHKRKTLNENFARKT